MDNRLGKTSTPEHSGLRFKEISSCPSPYGSASSMPRRIAFRASSIAPRFFAEVVQRDYGDFMITDESDLFDILDPAGVDKALDRMDEHYLVDSRACDSTRIVDLLELLHDSSRLSARKSRDSEKRTT